MNLAAFGIYRELKEPIETLLVVAGGTGLGMGMMIHGRLVRGVRGGAGEIGDLRFGDASFEHELNARTLVTDDVAAGVPPEAVKQSLVRAAAGDAVAGRLVDNYSDALLALLTILETTFDPNRIELTGGVASSPAVVEAIKDRIGGSSLNSIVKWAERGPAAPAWGALEYARWGRPPEEDVGASVEHRGARR